MQPLRLDELRAETVEQPGVDGARWRAVFPFTPDAPGETVSPSAEYAVVYNELAPGRQIGRHRDGCDELLYVVAGRVEAAVGEGDGSGDGDADRVVAEAGELLVVPAGTPHSVTNVGGDTARLLGFFAEGDLDADFDREPRAVGT